MSEDHNAEAMALEPATGESTSENKTVDRTDVEVETQGTAPDSVADTISSTPSEVLNESQSKKEDGSGEEGNVSSTQTGEDGATPKRKRGRPRKGEVVPPKPENKVPKKRGRPPKSATSQSEDDQAKKKVKLNEVEKKKDKKEDKEKKDKVKKVKKDKEKDDKKEKKRKEKKDKKNNASTGDSRFPYKINISVGADQSTGPGFYSVTIVKCTLNSEELQKAYKAGTTKLGFDFQKEICTTNQNCALSSDHFKKLASCGIPVSDDGDGGEDNELDFELTLESYRDIWLHIARLGNPALNWVVAELDALPIGGNGLFQDLVEQHKLTDTDVDMKDKPVDKKIESGEGSAVSTN